MQMMVAFFVILQIRFNSRPESVKTRLNDLVLTFLDVIGERKKKINEENDFCTLLTTPAANDPVCCHNADAYNTRHIITTFHTFNTKIARILEIDFARNSVFIVVLAAIACAVCFCFTCANITNIPNQRHHFISDTSVSLAPRAFCPNLFDGLHNESKKKKIDK